MKQEKLRSEIDNKYKWDLTDLYLNDDEWKKDFEKLKKLYPNIKKYEGHILDSSQTLYETLNLTDEISQLIEKLYVYTNLKKDEDISVSVNQNMTLEVLNLYEKINNMTAFINPEILKSDYSLIEKYISELDELKKYEFNLKHLFKEKEHLLDKKDEELLSSFSSIIDNFSESSGYLRDSIMKFDNIHDKDGNEVELTVNNFPLYIKSSNRNVRKETNENYYKTVEQFNSALSTNYIGHLKYTVLYSKLRKYKDSLDSDLSSLNLDRKVFDNLLEVTNNNVGVYQKYIKLLKKVLKLDKVYSYDLSASLVNDDDANYTFEEAKDMILDCFKIYGSEYIEILTKAFEENWVDVFSNKNKTSGWYSCSIYSGHPHILANYNSKLEDVSALAHELGHAVNSYYSIKSNPYCLSDYSLFEAEVASLTNELVLGKYMLENTEDKNEKLEIINNMINLFIGNFFGGVRGAEFEYEVHSMLEKDKTLTPDILNQTWLNINKKMCGNLVEDPNMYGWSRIPHFYSDFYYFKYATGIAAASYISSKILTKDSKVIENYLNFLKVGGSKYPIDSLKVAGIDMNDPNVIKEAIKNFDSLLDEFEKVYNS